ncbi:hypothetical protein M0812_16866 [Anaeramoeba flamelloides]|uniref:RGS domain-containing protein n=1 Tax=Anaeramoeba flamelloides TaxID=1746091 RepID=A0AAV7Z794_9EUKA|nr:hypothetical protein M0812_16866 [Anaeramoeba flamelloides]
MWKRKNKNKHLNKKTNKQIELEKEERSLRLIGILESQRHELEYQLKTMQNQRVDLQNGLISQKIKETEERIVPHLEEKKQLKSEFRKIHKSVKKERVLRKNYLEQKNLLLKTKKDKIVSLHKKIQRFKANKEIGGVLSVLEKKNKKLTKEIRKTNKLKNAQSKCKKELTKLRSEEESGSWKTNMSKIEILKIEQEDYIIQQLTIELNKQEKRLRKMEFQKSFQSGSSRKDLLRDRQKILKFHEKINRATQENKKLKQEILEIKELVGEEANPKTNPNSNSNPNSCDLQTDDSLTDPESNQIRCTSSPNIISSSNTTKKKHQEHSKLNIKTEREEKKTLKISNSVSLIYKSKDDSLLITNKTDPKNERRLAVQSDSSTKVISELANQESKNSLSDNTLNSTTYNHLFSNSSNCLPSIGTKTKKTKEFSIDSLQTLLSIPIGVDYFKEYLDSCMCQENIMFWMEVKSMKQKAQSQKEINKLSKKIFKKYIIEESPFEINIISSTRTKLLKQYQNKIFFSKMFNEASDAVFKHMFLNSWNEFQETKQFQQLSNKVKQDPNFLFSRSVKKVKLRYNIQSFKALNEEFEFHDKIMHPLLVVEKLLKYLIQLFYINYKISAEWINLKNINSKFTFQQFEILSSQLKFIKLSDLKNTKEKISFFLNVYNLLSLHAFLSNGAIPYDKSSWDHFQENSVYLIDGSYFSLSDIFNGILRANTSPKSHSSKYFKANDERAKYSLSKIQPMIHFATIDPYRETILKIYKPNTLMQDLKKTTIILLQPSLNIKKGEKIILSKSFQVYEKDFQVYGDILNWISIFFEMKVMSNIFTNPDFKFTTKIFKYPKLIINFSEFSIYGEHFLK